MDASWSQYLDGSTILSHFLTRSAPPIKQIFETMKQCEECPVRLKVTKNISERRRTTTAWSAWTLLILSWTSQSPVYSYSPQPLPYSYSSSSRSRRTTPSKYPKNRIKTTPPPSLLSRREERALLLRFSEYRRIRDIKTDLALQDPRLAPSVLKHAEACGYDSDCPASIEYLETIMEEGPRIRETLVTSNMGLVRMVVNTVLGTKRLRSLSKEDLVQEGAIGLARAIDKFDPSRETKLSTYAVYWIRALVLRCIAERDDLVRVPEHILTGIRKMRRAAGGLGLDFDTGTSAAWKEATKAKELAIEAGLSESQFDVAMRVGEGRSYTGGGVIEFQPWMTKDMLNTDPNDDDYDVNNMKLVLSQFLRPKEMKALSLRYGLEEPDSDSYRDYQAEAEEDIFGANGILSIAGAVRKNLPPSTLQTGRWGESLSFKEIGKQMAVSSEYGRRLCGKALEKLRIAVEDGRLDPAMLSY